MEKNAIKLNATYQKDYYGKAYIIPSDDGGAALKSYETLVCKIDSDGNFTRLWNGYSRTTMNHINDFRKLYDLPALNKAAWMATPCENKERYQVEFNTCFILWRAEVVFDSYDDAELYADTVLNDNPRILHYDIVKA